MKAFGTDKREAFIAAAVAWYGANHEGQSSWSYIDMCRAQRLARRLGLPDYIEPSELDSGQYHWMAADYYRSLRSEHGPKGCTRCACRDCLETSTDGEACQLCSQSGCCDLGGAECERESLEDEPSSAIVDTEGARRESVL